MSTARQNYLKKFKSSLRSYAKKGWDVSTINPDTLSTSILRKGAQAYITGKATKISEVTGEIITYSPYRARQEGVAKAKQTVVKKSEDSITYRFKRQAQQEMALAKARLSQAEKRYFKAKADKVTADLKYKGKLSAAKSKAQLEFDKKENKLADAEREYLSKQKYYLEMYVPTSFEYKKREEELEKYRQEKEYEEYYATAQWSSPKPETAEEKIEKMWNENKEKWGLGALRPLQLKNLTEEEKKAYESFKEKERKKDEERSEALKLQQDINLTTGKWTIVQEGYKVLIIDTETGEVISIYERNKREGRELIEYLYDSAYENVLEHRKDLINEDDDEEHTDYSEPDYGFEDYDEEYFSDDYNTMGDVNMTIDDMEKELNQLLNTNSENDEVLAYIKQIKEAQEQQEGRENFYKRIQSRFMQVAQNLYVVASDSKQEQIVRSASLVIGIIKDVPTVPTYMQDEIRSLVPNHTKSSKKKAK